MLEIMLFGIGLIVGAVSISPYLAYKHVQFRNRKKKLEEEAARSERELRLAAEQRQKMVDDKIANLDRELKSAAEKSQQLQQLEKSLQARESRFVTYTEMEQENQLLKRDLQNIDVNLNKVELDGELRQRKQAELDRRSQSLGRRYLDDTIKATVLSVGPNNFAACKQKLLKVINWCREIGFEVPEKEEADLLAQLKMEFEKAVKAEFEREEQARIKAQIRDEERLQREVDAELKRLARERAVIQAALDRALAEARDQHSAEVQSLQARLAEAEEKSKRAISMAQQTKSGNVYVISNIGSFGKDVFKIGMTRRLEPLDRVYELSSASVPFPFDVHMMIACNDAPGLESALHRELQKTRINRVNPRKEYFKANVEEIAAIVRKHHGEIQYTADPEALQYHQSITMSEEDAAFIETTYATAEEEDIPVTDDV